MLCGPASREGITPRRLRSLHPGRLRQDQKQRRAAYITCLRLSDRLLMPDLLSSREWWVMRSPAAKKSRGTDGTLRGRIANDGAARPADASGDAAAGCTSRERPDTDAVPQRL